MREYIKFEDDYRKLVLEQDKLDIGSEIISAFTGNGLTFNKKNWNDAVLSELRDYLEELFFKYGGEFHKINRDYYSICLSYSHDCSQKHVFIKYLDDDYGTERIIYISWYKSRGRTETIEFLSEQPTFCLVDLYNLYKLLELDLTLTLK